VRARTRARELALQFLYQVDFQGEGYRSELDAFLEEALDGKTGAEDAKEYARLLVDGVIAKRHEIDKRIQEVARNWDLERMAAVDRNVLRIGTYELLYEEEIPVKVAINEGIELGKKFSTEASGAFVNGILDRIRKDVGK
jgi:transcription antitermination factor NusB